MKPEDPEERAETQISTTPHKQEAELRIKPQPWRCEFAKPPQIFTS